MSFKRLISLFLFGVCLQAPASQAGIVDGDPGVNQSANTGTYVWRDSSDIWHLQLVSASTQNQEFSGTFNSTQSINLMSNSSLEGHDNVSLTSYNTLATDLLVYQNGRDEVNFTTASNAGLCLRDSSGARRTVYLGANSVAATTPVDLTGTGACGNNSGSTSTGEGLYIDQVSSQNWQVRMDSVTNSYAFKGTFEATQDFNSYQPYQLESSTDSVELTAADALAVSFATWSSGGTDGADFSIASSAGICLRETSTSGVPVYLNNTPVTLPVDLTGSGACSGSTSGGTTSGGTGGNPGHWLVLMNYANSQEIMAQSMYAGLQGWLKKYTWASVEPTRGNYNFSKIQSDLDFAASQGMHLIVMIEDKTFRNEHPNPPYLQGSQYERRNDGKGYTAIRWNSLVASRFKALMVALGNRFDGHPAFEGVLPGSESAPSLPSATLDATGYTPEKYRDALIDVFTATARSVPNSRVFWFMNFFPRKQDYIADVADALVKEGNVVMGGPDDRPDDAPVRDRVYPFYQQFQGKMDLLVQVEPSCYNHLHEDTSYPTKYWTMPELFRYARDTLHVKYMLWSRFPGWADGGYGWEDALPVIANNPVFNQ